MELHRLFQVEHQIAWRQGQKRQPWHETQTTVQAFSAASWPGLVPESSYRQESPARELKNGDGATLNLATCDAASCHCFHLR